jgi:hypothetical protein
MSGYGINPEMPVVRFLPVERHPKQGGQLKLRAVSFDFAHYTSRAKLFRVHRVPPRVRDDRDTHLLRGGMAESTDLFPPNGEAKYFWCAHWTRNCRDNPSGKSTDPPAAAIEASVGSNVDSKPILRPRTAACSIIASLGLSTGIGACSRATASMQGPKAEHVKRIASVPVLAA